MSVTQSIRKIYKGPFKQYLRISEKIGGVVYEQSKLVDILFLLEINLLNIIQKYKKPLHIHVQNILIEPLSIQIRRVKKLINNNLSSTHILHLTLVSEAVNIFEWAKWTNIEESVKRIQNEVTPYLNKLKNEVLKLDIKHVDWIFSWNQWLDGMSKLVIDFFREGIVWTGTEELPTYLLGDISDIYKRIDHLRLCSEINRGENITQILRRRHLNNEEEEEE